MMYRIIDRRRNDDIRRRCRLKEELRRKYCVDWVKSDWVWTTKRVFMGHVKWASLSVSAGTARNVYWKIGSILKQTTSKASAITVWKRFDERGRTEKCTTNLAVNDNLNGLQSWKYIYKYVCTYVEIYSSTTVLKKFSL